MIPYNKRAYRLLHEGSIALAQVEHNGIRMDVDYLDNIIKEIDKKITELQKNLKESEVYITWKKTYGKKLNFNSGIQLGEILFSKMGFDPPAYTDSGKFSVDESSLSSINHPFVKDYLEIKKLQKVSTTYLKGLRREIANGYLHPFFNLHITRTFRSSSSSPNFQNLPIRDPELGRIVRKAFIAREGNHIVELDFSGLEVCIAAGYHKDPTMLEYIKDKTKDMHRDMAQECFALPFEEMHDPKDDEDGKRIKRIRYCGKNMFVFPQFYGDWYLDCARSLWAATESMDLVTRDGAPLREHLREVGIFELGDLNPKEKPREGTFERHIQKVEEAFWNERFPVYSKWKKKWFEEYKKKGYFISKTGFICQGHMKKNEIINYPVQGSAFHCLLQSLIWIQEEIEKRGMKTLIIGQIHDSIVADVPHNELKKYLKLANHIMTKRLSKEWKWINVPLEIEAEVSPLNGCWADKKEMEI